MLEIITLDQAEKWDSIVRTFKNHDVYWLSGYVKGFFIHGDGTPIMLYFHNEKVRGINVVMKRDISKDSHYQGKIKEDSFFDFSTPYGYGGWLIEGEESSEDLFSTYYGWCKKNHIVSEFVRFHPVIRNHKYCEDFYHVIELGKTVTIDLSSPESIWNNFTSQNRNKIRKAEKNGIKIYNGRYPAIFYVFREIYNETMDKDNALPYYYFENEFYNSICEGLEQNAQVFYAMLDDKCIAASIMLACNGKMNYHLSGIRMQYANMAPTNLLLYKAALWGFSNGCRSLYLGGGVGSEDDSLLMFKKSFYRSDNYDRFYIGKRVLNEEYYNELLNLRGQKIQNTQFFPQYRAD